MNYMVKNALFVFVVVFIAMFMRVIMEVSEAIIFLFLLLCGFSGLALKIVTLLPPNER
jgi:hypothetical protein